MALVKNKISAPYVIGRFEQHTELKDRVLSAINEQEGVDRLSESGDELDISRCDWRLGRWDYNRKWFQLLQPHWHNHMLNVSKELGYEYYRLKEIWFQQYEKMSHHGWHVHGSNWTNVYYLELPKDSPKTEFIDPYSQTGVYTFDVKEGDILTFPSYVIHRAPVNLGNDRKTIISWNMDTELKPGHYSE